MDVIKKHGGLHRFMGWDGPILTDSGGFQVFSLENMRKIDDDGVTFRSHIDGSPHRFTPELAIEIQECLGSDIAMCLDECPPADATREHVARAMDRTTEWAIRSKARQSRPDQNLFGITQGGIFDDLRLEHAQRMIELDFPGYAVGGLSVGEEHEDRARILDLVPPVLPHNKPRYLMGIGRPVDIVEAVLAGIDMMDCVLPSRNARMGTAYTSEGRLNIRNAKFRDDLRPLDDQCTSLCCQRFSRSYIRHLYTSKEILSNTLLTLHNLSHYQRLMREIREAITHGGLDKIYAREQALASSKEAPGPK